jgi:hypothetical protein
MHPDTSMNILMYNASMRLSLDKHLARGAEAYEDVLGFWWRRQSGNPAHRCAYRRVEAPACSVDHNGGAHTESTRVRIPPFPPMPSFRS